MIAWPRPLLWCGALPTALVAALSLAQPQAVSALQHATYDAILRLTPAAPPGGRVVIVDVDERSLSAVGQWPWRRDVIGQLVTRIRDHDAAAIALDIIFAEPDRDAGSAVRPDAAMAAALHPGRVILGYGMTFDPEPDPRDPAAARNDACVQHPLVLPILRDRGDHAGVPFFQATGAVCSLPMLVTAAGASGFLNAAPDADGLLRRAPLLLELHGHVYPALGLAAVSAVSGIREVSLRVAHVNASQLVLTGDADTRVVPLDGQSNLLLRYRGPKRTFTYVSAVDALEGRVSRDTFADRLVLVGTTALGTREVVSTPLDTLFTGVEVQATIADNLLQGDFIRRAEHGVALETLAVLILGLTATLMAARYSLAWTALALACGAAACWGGAVWILSDHGRFVSPLFPTLGLVSAVAGTTVAGFTIERRRAERASAERAAARRLMVQTLLSLTEIKDAETGSHSRRTQLYTRVLSEELARHPHYRSYLTPERIDLLAALAPLHDIGKVGVPDRILNKPGALTPEELVEMRKHPVHGRDVILNAERDAGVHDDVTLAIAKDIVYTHHERWDGTGYPEGLTGETIPIPGRIVAVVDVYDASTTRRRYMPSLSQDEAVALIVRGRGTHFDPAVVDAFLRVAPVLRDLSEHEHAA